FFSWMLWGSFRASSDYLRCRRKPDNEGSPTPACDARVARDSSLSSMPVFRFQAGTLCTIIGDVISRLRNEPTARSSIFGSHPVRHWQRLIHLHADLELPAHVAGET